MTALADSHAKKQAPQRIRHAPSAALLACLLFVPSLGLH